MPCAAPSPSVSDPLATALHEFQAGLTTERRAGLTALKSVPDTNAVVAFTAELDNKNAARRSRGVASRLCGVLQSIQQYSTILDTFSQSHADVAALVWGSLKLTLLVASNFASFFDKLSEWFMRLGSSCPRYSTYQVLYAQYSRLQMALTEFYATVVRFCSKATQVMARTGFAQLKAILWKSYEVEFAEFERDLRRQNGEVNAEIRLASDDAAHQARQLQLMEQKERQIFRKMFNRATDEMRAWQIQVNLREGRARKQRLIDQLSEYNYLDGLKKVRKLRHGVTGSWLARTGAYQTWLKRTDSEVLWLSGIVGSGKSVITGAVIDELFGRYTSNEAAISFFFSQYDHANSLLAKTVLGSLIQQRLTVDNLPDTIEAQLATLFRGMSPDAKDLKPVMGSVFELSRIQFLIIDGLDECEKPDRDAILHVLSEVVSTSRSALKIFISSREDIDKEIKKAFPTHLSQKMRSQAVDDDIRSFVEDAVAGRVSHTELTVGDPQLLIEIQDALVRGAGGMFLWVAHQLKDLCAETCDEDIRMALTNLPKDLPQTYERALRRVLAHGKKDLAKKVFAWIGAAVRPLRLEELREAIAVAPGQACFMPSRCVNDVDRIIGWCGTLITLDTDEQQVRFVHHSVKDYLSSELLDDSSGIGTFQFCSTEADHSAGELCVTYLSFSNFERQLIKATSDEIVDPSAILTASVLACHGSALCKTMSKLDRIRGSRPAPKVDVLRHLASVRLSSQGDAYADLGCQYAFLEYARKNWLLHTTRLSNTSVTWNMWKKLLTATTNLAVKPWTVDDLAAGDARVVEYIVDHTHGALLEFILSSEGKYMLHSERKDLLMMVLKNLREQPIKRVVEYEPVQMQKDVLRDLLPRARLDEHYTRLVQELLSLRGLLDPTGHACRDALRCAAICGDHEFVAELIAAGVVTTVSLYPAFDGAAEAALEDAAEAGHDAVVKILIKAGAALSSSVKEDLIMGKSDSQTCSKAWEEKLPLLEREGLEMTRRLLRHGSDSHYEWTGSRALTKAAGKGHLKVVERLLAAGSKVNDSIKVTTIHVFEKPSLERYESSALRLAAAHCHVEVVKRLLNAGADRHGTLLEAAENGHLGVVALLVEASYAHSPSSKDDADADVQQWPPRTALRQQSLNNALCTAVEFNHLAVVKYLLAANAQLNHWTFRIQSIFQVFMSSKPVWEVWCETPLCAATRRKNLIMIERLLAAGADPNEHTKGEDSALDIAKVLRDEKVSSLLLAAGGKMINDGSSLPSSPQPVLARNKRQRQPTSTEDIPLLYDHPYHSLQPLRHDNEIQAHSPAAGASFAVTESVVDTIKNTRRILDLLERSQFK